MAWTVAPRRCSAAGVVWQEAPWPQSTATTRPSSLRPSSVSMAWSTYALRASFILMMWPTPAPVGSVSAAMASSDMTQALISSSTASGSFIPLRLKNLMPLNSGGLCEAEMTMPPSSSFWTVSSATAGVGMTPQQCGRPPSAMMPAVRALSSMVPERRVSRPTQISGPRNLVAARPRRNARSHERSALATPRTPSVPKMFWGIGSLLP